MKCASPFIVATLLCASPVYAAERHSAPTHHPQVGPVQRLSPDLLQLLKQEMVAIQDGMKTIMAAIPAGRWSEVAKVGESIRASFILQQKLTPAQAHELHQVLPGSFLELDGALHRYAGMLAHAASIKNPEMATFYFFKMTDTCVACHSRFAQHRFPDFAESPAHQMHQH